MSQENVKTVLDAIAAFNRGGPDAWSEFFADDIDYRAVEGGIDDPGPIRDRDTLRVYGQDWLDTFDDFRVEAPELIDAGEENVIAVIRTFGRAKLSGVEMGLTFAVVFTIRDGRIAVGREYATRKGALEAAGLSE